MESQNPYAPPKTVVDDVPSGAAPPRPPQVTRAVRLLWASVVIGFVAGIVNLVATDRPVTNYSGGSVHDIALLISWSIALLIIWWILSSIRKGKNWARIVQVVLFVLGILSVLMVLVMPGHISGIVWMVYAVQMSLNVWGMILLFSIPANAWFRDMKEWR